MIDNVCSSTTDEEFVLKLRDAAVAQDAPPLVLLKLDDLTETLHRRSGETCEAGCKDGAEESHSAHGSYSEGWDAGYREGLAAGTRGTRTDG
jgi:hypothetical protein